MLPPRLITRRAVLLGALASAAFPAAFVALADGGDLAALRTGEWRVTEIDGEQIADGTAITIAFGADDAYSGRACNAFRGSYASDGVSLTLGQAAATRMACAGPAMSQENALFDAFSRVTGFHVQRNGALWLTGAGDGDGRIIVASR